MNNRSLSTLESMIRDALAANKFSAMVPDDDDFEEIMTAIGETIEEWHADQNLGEDDEE
jgi:hypothetical protein